ncbi:MAG: ABC transporter substrate-binding protein [Nitrospinae bacterium]|nr:ABC transporter substrate-binding protein [Nitrospinota bacterium]
MEGSTMYKIIPRNPWLVIGISFALILSAGKAVQASSITDGLKATIDQVISVVTDPQYQDDRQTRRAKMKGIIFPKFNFLEMGKRSLGSKRWKERSPEERKVFIDVFGKLLENSYANKLESYHDEKINYVDEIVKGKYAMVKTEVIRKNGTVNVDYKLIRGGGEWRVYDIVVEGVSLIKNYRSQFARIIHQDSFDTLMEKLNAKVDKLEDGQDGNQDDEDKI